MEMSVRALIVDDQPIVRGLLRLRLARLGCEVEEAENAHAGLEMFLKFSPHLVTLDVVMPTVGGVTALDLLRRIRESGNQTDVVVISSKVENREAFLKEGAIEFVSKPFENFEGLVRKLQPLIQALEPEAMESK
jgi:CheY-like chemotaxis protein